jgi:phosphoribosylglycinamide formyltransferase-1
LPSSGRGNASAAGAKQTTSGGAKPPDIHTFPIAVLASGSGTNLQAILDTVHGRDGITVDVVIANRPGSQALERAAAAGVDTAVFDATEYADREERDRAMAEYLIRRGVRLVVLAGYMHLLDPRFLAEFPHAVINVHPALLPAFPGANPVRDQIAYGVKVSGVTVHFVDDGVDTGAIILQEAVTLPPTRNEDEILTVLHRIEHELLPRAIRLFARGGVRIDPDDPRCIHIDEGVLSEHG